MSEQDAHLSVVNLVIKPPPLPLSSLPTRDPLSLILRHRRSQGKSQPQSGSIHDLDESIDSDQPSETLSNSMQPLNPSILSVKSIVPSIGPQPGNHR